LENMIHDLLAENKTNRPHEPIPADGPDDTGDSEYFRVYRPRDVGYDQTYHAGLSIMKLAELASYCAFLGRGFFHAVDDPRPDVEPGGDVYDFRSKTRINVQLHAVAHVKHFVHLFPSGPAFFLDDPEQWRQFK